jgi:tetratricopeptide (TPR) repeat protein
LRAADKLRGKDAGAQAETREVALGLALAIQGFFARYLGDAERATPLTQESLSLLRKHGVRRELALCAWFAALGIPEDDPRHRQLSQESLAISRATDFYLGTVLALRRLGRYEEALRISRAADDWRGTAFALGGLGQRAYARQAYTKARQLYEESLSLRKKVGIQWAIGASLNNLGAVALALGEVDVAKARYWEAHDHCERIGYGLGILRALAGLGNAALIAGDHVAALRYYRQALGTALEFQSDPFVHGAACRLDVVTGWAVVLAGTDGERAAELVALARHHLSSTEETRDKAQKRLEELQGQLAPAAYAAAVERGRARDLEATVRELLGDLGEQQEPGIL